MADVLNRKTKEFLPTVNTPDYPESDWIRSPDLSAVAGIPSKYWLVEGDSILLMDEKMRVEVDTAEAQFRLERFQAVFDKSIANVAKDLPLKTEASLEDRIRALEYIIYGR